MPNNLVLCVIDVPAEFDTKQKVEAYLKEMGLSLKGIERFIYRQQDWEPTKR